MFVDCTVAFSSTSQKIYYLKKVGIISFLEKFLPQYLYNFVCFFVCQHLSTRPPEFNKRVIQKIHISV